MRDLHAVDPATDSERVPDEWLWGGLRVPAGHVVQTGYVATHDVICHAPHGHQLYPAEVERAYKRQLELGQDQGWPPPTGYWREDGRFVLTDGRNAM